ncbi:MAG: undecaprenyl-diphosphate phosphatase [Chromatiales bacterium]|nr:undecaprenyl-diphosphate phosphatase [Chromatiales bacterium]
MDWIQIVVLAVVQGITEFLPISSSAHLILAPLLLGWPDQGQAFDVAVHVGTLAAVVSYFHRDVWSMSRAWARSLFTGESDEASNLAWAVIWATVPAGLTGLIAAGPIETYLRSPMVIAAATIGFGLVLGYAAWQAKGNSREVGSIGWRDVVVIGLAQCLALIPGTSRSGITIAAGLLMKLAPGAAARFSFLLSIPLIGAAGSLHTLKLIEGGMQAQWDAIALGAVLSAISAFACIHVFLKLLERVGMLPFIVYRLILGVFLLFLLW